MTLQGKPPLAPGGTEVRAGPGRAGCWARGRGGQLSRGAGGRVEQRHGWARLLFANEEQQFVTDGACAQKTAGRVFRGHPWLTARGLRDYRMRP